ncbi:MAG TPA: class II SORL domain-containing protein [Deltaproteobacteria bacterium]|nr:class II SORL domain-containing protein [Deltaproteobacteria bacterium]HQI81538.1 class II SORL domain-containing protein [Deltaproteobacteria bacterium]
MITMGELFQKDDWKKEKHVPVIECSDRVKADEVFQVKVSLGKEIAHPNTTEHHIRWIQLFFKPQGDKYPYQVGCFEFTAHGESVEGPNKGPVYTNHTVVAELKVNKPGTLVAASFCNIHGLWESSRDIQLG